MRHAMQHHAVSRSNSGGSMTTTTAFCAVRRPQYSSMWHLTTGRTARTPLPASPRHAVASLASHQRMARTHHDNASPAFRRRIGTCVYV